MKKQERLRIGLIGYGRVGQDIATLVLKSFSQEMVLIGALIRHSQKVRSPVLKTVTNLSDLLTEYPDVVVEVAGHEGLRMHGPTVLQAGIDLYFISVGALANPVTMKRLRAAGENSGAQARIVTGAIGALDALAAASVDNSIATVTHTLRKPPHLLPSYESTWNTETAHEVFRGSARQAVLQFPEFLNVAAAVALASKGLDHTEVVVLADPAILYGKHEIMAQGAFGRLYFEIENLPIEGTSHGAKLVAMSIVHALRQRYTSYLIGS